MDDTISRRGTTRRKPTHTNPRNHRTYNLRSHATANSHTFTRYNERRGAGFLQAQAADLRTAKSTLIRLYTQEQQALMRGGINARECSLQVIRSSRASAERRYVNCLIRYCRDAGRMSAVQAGTLQSVYTRDKMGMGMGMGGVGAPSSGYLLGMYPRELL